MKQLGNSSSTVLVALWLALVANASSALAGPGAREHEQPAQGLESILLAAGNGSARIAAGDDDRVRIRVAVSPRQWSDAKPWRSIRNWFLSSPYDDVEALLEAVRIDVDERPRGRLRVGLLPTTGNRKDKLSEEWTIAVPARLAVAVRMDNTQIEIAGIAGGADVRAGKGSVRIEVPAGDLRVELRVGDVVAKTGSGSVGDVDLRTVVGSTRLWLEGRRLEVPDPPGPGSEISITGPGEEAVRVAVEVGDISVDIGGGGARAGGGDGQ